MSIIENFLMVAKILMQRAIVAEVELLRPKLPDC